MRRLLRILFFLSVVRPLLGLIIGINLFGKENLPVQTQFILVANHNSHLDAVALMNLFPLKQLHRVHPVAASDYFMRNQVVAWISRTLLNIIPIPRDHITKHNNPITMMGEVLAQGDSLIVFPEGSRGEPEVLAPFKSGIAHLVQRHPDVPVIPVFMKNMGKSLPKGEYVLVPFFCDVVVGEPQFFKGKKEEIVQALEDAVHKLERTLELETGAGEEDV